MCHLPRMPGWPAEQPKHPSAQCCPAALGLGLERLILGVAKCCKEHARHSAHRTNAPAGDCGACDGPGRDGCSSSKATVVVVHTIIFLHVDGRSSQTNNGLVGDATWSVFAEL